MDNLLVFRSHIGAIAQLVERLHGMQEVSGSTPLGSTMEFKFKIARNRIHSFINIAFDFLVFLIEGNALYVSTGAVVNQAINTARNNFFWGNKEKIQGFQFSAVIDQKTTAVCASLGQKMFKIEDASALVNRPPLHWNYRSILLPILIGDAEPE